MVTLDTSAVIACAERNGGRALTYHYYRHVGTIAAEGRITLVQER